MKIKRKIIIGADHAGYAVKEYIKSLLKRKKNIEVIDAGTYFPDRVDYPDYAEKVGRMVQGSKNTFGILACATGIGISIAANKMHGIRAGLAHTPRDARLSRQHNDANILVVGGRPYNRRRINNILNAWLHAEFEGGRHARRIKKITRIEKNN